MQYIIYTLLYIMWTGQPIQCAYPNIKETIPASSLGYHTNNKYDSFPPLMQDGRAITASWQPEAVLNNFVKNAEGIQSNWKYRQYLTNNATEIMSHHFVESCNDAGYFILHTEAPKLSTSDNHSPTLYASYVDNNEVNGASDLKQLYLSREQLNARKVSPVISQAEVEQYTSMSNVSRKI